VLEETMKRIAIALALVTCLAIPVLAQETKVDESDMKAIGQAALDYVQGYFEGSGERMERGLNPEFHKLYVRALPNGRDLLLLTSRSMLIEGANAGMGKDLEKAKAVTVEILNVYKNIASVRINSPDFIDMAHIAKINGQWQVVNVLWAPTK
jgi:hypothetical protein